MLNWEMEFKKWCPAFKLLTYYGTAKERKAKRQGWSKPNAFHVCITSYTLVLQDAKVSGAGLHSFVMVGTNTMLVILLVYLLLVCGCRRDTAADAVRLLAAVLLQMLHLDTYFLKLLDVHVVLL